MRSTTFLVTLLISVILVSSGHSQTLPEKVGSYELSSGSISVGRGVVTSGLDLSVILMKDDDSGRKIALQGNHDRAYFMSTYPINGKTSISGLVGQFKNLPEVALLFEVCPTKFFSVIVWPFVSAGTLETGPKFRPSILACSVITTLNTGPISWSGTAMYFEPLPYVVKMAGAKYSYNLNNRYTLFGEFQHDFTGSKETYFSLGLKTSFNID